MSRNILKSNPSLLLYGGVLKRTCYSYVNLWLPAADFIEIYSCLFSRIYALVGAGWSSEEVVIGHPSQLPWKFWWRSAYYTYCTVVLSCENRNGVEKKTFHFPKKSWVSQDRWSMCGDMGYNNVCLFAVMFPATGWDMVFFPSHFLTSLSHSCYSHRIMKCGFVTLVPLFFGHWNYVQMLSMYKIKPM